MRRTLTILATIGALTLAACSSSDEPPVEAVDDATGATIRDYPDFADVDPYTSEFFVTLEATSLAETQGEERLYNLGLGVCRNLDRGNTIDQELLGLIADARLSQGDAGSLVGAAASDMCPQHGDTVETWVAANGG